MNAAFAELKAADFPVTVSAHLADSGEEVWREVLEAPGALYIPPLQKTHGPVLIRTRLACGTATEYDPRTDTARTVP